MAIQKLWLKVRNLPELVFHALEDYINDKIIDLFNAYNLDETNKGIGSSSNVIGDIYAEELYLYDGVANSTYVRNYYNALNGYTTNLQNFAFNQWNVAFAGTNYYRFSTSGFIPLTNNSYDLGTDAFSWQNLYGYTGDFKTSVITPLIGTDTATALKFQTNGTQRWQVGSGGSILPIATNSYNFGSASNEIASMYAKKADLSGNTVSTNFQHFGNFGDASFYTSDGTTPNGNLTPGKDYGWCFDVSGSGGLWYHTGGNSWTAK